MICNYKYISSKNEVFMEKELAGRGVHTKMYIVILCTSEIEHFFFVYKLLPLTRADKVKAYIKLSRL